MDPYRTIKAGSQTARRYREPLFFSEVIRQRSVIQRVVTRALSQVSILLVGLMFIFASFGVQMYGGKLAACNDPMIARKEECIGIFYQEVWISNSLSMDGEAPGQRHCRRVYF